ncbi:unnamed protein product [Cuscuta europaea]|uniref:BRCT domain-containing protein n=1 Tax=Cuscuta europaea TaxID=41803 RepID=A0A9P0ZCT1_CUSEU|nr:unnamed protein product [Cuscuta europaea]
MFTGMVVLLIGGGVQTRRLQIWKQKLMQMGASIENHFSRKVTHVFAVDSDLLLKEVDRERLIRSKTKVLQYQWIESSLREGKAMPEDLYVITIESGGGNMQNFSAENRSYCDEQTSKKSRVSSDGVNVASLDHMTVTEHYSGSSCDSDIASNVLGPEVSCEVFLNHHDKDFLSDSSLLYKPPDLNKNVTEIFGKLINIYRALGDERRSFSYYKAILVIEKLPSKIENLDQVKHLPSIGKSMQDHILEIVNTRKLSKLEHFEKDEKVRTITLFGEVWGIGPATALKLYEKGNRTLDDLKNEESLTNAQRLGLKYFHDIKVRIPRHEVEEMEQLLKKAGEEILPGTWKGILWGYGYSNYSP